MVEGTTPGDALPPPPRRATPARRGAHCGASAGSPRPHRPHPGHRGRGTLAACSRGRAAGGGTAPDTRRPSERWQATSPEDALPPPPRHAAPTGHAGRGDGVGLAHPHTRAHSTWVADANSPPSGRAVGGGTAPGLRRPPQWWKAPPPGTPFRQPHSEQRRPARSHAVGPVLGPHARTDRTRDTRVAKPWLPAPEDGRPGKGQRLTPDTSHNGGRPTPPGTAPHHPRGTQPPQGMPAKGTVLGPHTHTPAPTARGWRTPTARPVGGQSGKGQRLTSDAPHNGGRHPPPGTPFRHPHSEQRRPAKAHAVRPVLGPHACTNRTRDTRDAEPWLPAPEDRRPGEGQRLTPGAPHNGGRPTPLGTAPHHPRGMQPPKGEAVPRTPWLVYGIQPVSGPLTPCTEGKTPVDAPFRAVKPRIGNRCTASGDLCIRISGINRVLFSYCFRQFLRFRSDTHCFDCWRLDRDFTVTASLTVYNGNFNAIRHEGFKAFRNCMDASAIFTSYTRNLNPNFSGCQDFRIFDFDIPALDLTSFEWTYVLPYARINFPFIRPSICLKDMGKTKLIREATCEGHISCCLRGITIRKRGMYSQYSRRNLESIICLASPHVRASVMDHGQEGRVCVTTHWP